MLRKIFSALLVISVIVGYYYKDNIYSYIKGYVSASNSTTSDDREIIIDNMTVASSTAIDNKAKQWIYTFDKRLNDKDSNDKVISIYYDQYHDVYFHYLVGELRANTNNDVDTSWNDYLSTLLDKGLKQKLADNRANLEYLDLRFPNKLFYKFKNIDSNINNNQNDQRILGTSTISSSTRR